MFSSGLFKNKQKKALLHVIAPLAFWSYDNKKLNQIPDSSLIQAVLIHGNDPLRKRLFNIFPHWKIKKVWEQEIVISGSRYTSLNKKIAADFLRIADPDRYIEEAYSKHNLYDRFSSAHP